MTHLGIRRLDGAWLSILVIGALGTFIWLYLLTANLFVFTEARDMIAWHDWPGDVWQWLLFPELAWGPGRLTGLASFQLTGRLCGTDLACVNGVGAAMFSVATVLLLVHTRQIIHSRAIAIGVAILWVLSPTVLGISMWQSARFDTLAFIGVVSAGIVWWHVFSRRRLTWLGAMGTIIGSILLMAFAFNAKEATYVLAGMMPALAIVRGVGRSGAVIRNLALCVLPLAYAAWFIFQALTHILPAYAAQISNGAIVETSAGLTARMLGLSERFMFIVQDGGTFELLHAVTFAGFGVFAVAFVVATAIAVRNGALRGPLTRVRTRHPGWLVRRASPWLYTSGMLVTIMLLSARSLGAEVYYLPLAYWALLSLLGMSLRLIYRFLPHRRLALPLLLLLLVAPLAAGYAALLSEGSTYGRLAAASSQMADNGSILRDALAGRTVDSVSWRMEELGPDAFFVTRGESATFQPDNDIWPWLMQDRLRRVEVTALTEGTLDRLRASLPTRAGPGTVLILMAADYELLFVAHDGQVLWDPTAG